LVVGVLDIADEWTTDAAAVLDALAAMLNGPPPHCERELVVVRLRCARRSSDTLNISTAVLKDFLDLEYFFQFLHPRCIWKRHCFSISFFLLKI
jgi:hypothetical protein